MNSFIHTVIVAEGFDEQGNVVNIMEVVYCDDYDTAKQIAEFIYKVKDKHCLCLVQTIKLSTFEDVFKRYMNSSFGEKFNSDIVN